MGWQSAALLSSYMENDYSIPAMGMLDIPNRTTASPGSARKYLEFLIKIDCGFCMQRSLWQQPSASEVHPP